MTKLGFFPSVRETAVVTLAAFALHTAGAVALTHMTHNLCRSGAALQLTPLNAHISTNIHYEHLIISAFNTLCRAEDAFRVFKGVDPPPLLKYLLFIFSYVCFYHETCWNKQMRSRNHPLFNIDTPIWSSSARKVLDLISPTLADAFLTQTARRRCTRCDIDIYTF